MHGIIRQKNYHDRPDTSQVDVNRIVVRYADGRRVIFIPEAGRENFSEDDMRELVKVLNRASSTAEWAEVGNTTG